MLDGTEFYVVMKLVSGEQIMAVLRNEDVYDMVIESPMCIRTIPVMGTTRESVTCAPLCQFSDEKIYTIHKKDVVFCKKLHHVFIPHYRKIVEEHERQTFITKENNHESLRWDDEPEEENPEELTAEEVLKRIEMLEAILDRETQPEEREELIDMMNIIEGNDTIH